MLVLMVYWLFLIVYVVAILLFIRAAWGKSRKDKIAMLVRHKWRMLFIVLLFIPFINLCDAMWHAYTIEGMPPSSKKAYDSYVQESKIHAENVKRYCVGLSQQPCDMKLRVMEKNSYNTEQEYQAAVKQYCEGLSVLECHRKLNTLK